MASHTHTDLDQKKSLRAYRQTSKPTTIELVGGIYCYICQSTYPNKKDYDNHYAQHMIGGEVVYTCVVCHKQMTSYPSFRGHCYTIHVIKDKYKCEHCSKNFSNVISLKDHIKVTHTFKCSTCSKQFTSKNELQLHQIIHNNSESPPYHCQVCEVQISTLDGCKDHIDMHSVCIYFCPICNENISSRDKAAEHLNKHFDDCNDNSTIEAVQNFKSDETSIEQLGGISCDYCTTKFMNRVEFDAHFSCDHGDKDIVYVCVVCDKKFEKYSVFFEHAYNHLTKDRFCCSICLRTFSRVSLLAAHMTVCQADPAEAGGRKPFACHRCGHRYGLEARLRQHLQDAHGVHCIECPVEGCHEMFTSPKEYIFHQYVHNSQQNWCRQCGIPFNSLTSCEGHLDVHKKKLFGCPVCNRNYGEKYLLMNHINQHFESIVHVCKVCGKVYNIKRRFTDHLKTHSETKLHNCTYCSKGFPNLNRLQEHLNTHTGSKPYKCTICSKTFASYPNWFKHKRRMHNIDSKSRKQAENYSDDEMINENVKKANVDETVNIQDLNVDASLSKNEEMLLDSPQVDLKLKTFTFDAENIMEPECIDPIEIEKELQILENYQMNNPTSDAELVDVLSTVGPIFDDVPVQVNESPNMDEHSVQPINYQTNYPPEYGPEFTLGEGSGFLDLDDHMLPHIDPLLTIKTAEYNMANNYQTLLPTMDPGTYEVPPNWEPPIFTKVCPEYSYGYGDMVDANRLSMMNTDIF